jgi:outer membrane putative beta-barrel porin/alpha-amylase
MNARLLAAAGSIALASLGLARPAAAQDIEPRTYANAPIGVNFLIAGYAYTRGALEFDTAADITDAHLRTSNAVLGYARVFDLAGSAATIAVGVPYTWLSGTATFQGDPVERVVNGFANPAVRLTWNFYGAPAMPLRDFLKWDQDVVIGASLRVMAPWSQYDDSRAINIGTNRWSFKPEVGISKTRGPWTFELALGATFYTVNDDFFGGNRREQDPLYSAQAHAIYGFAGGSWLAVDATYFAGGRTTLNGVLNADLQQNWRGGAVFAFPIDRLNSIKLSASSGFSDRTGNSYDLIGILWQHRWGGGL